MAQVKINILRRIIADNGTEYRAGQVVVEEEVARELIGKGAQFIENVSEPGTPVEVEPGVPWVASIRKRIGPRAAKTPEPQPPTVSPKKPALAATEDK